MQKALIYCRISSPSQKTDGDGLRSQEHRCREYAKNKGYIIAENGIFKDDYTGGGDFMKRPAMAKMLAHMDKNIEENYKVIFDDLKRFARDTMFHFKLKSELKARNATLECLNFKFEETPEGEFVETIFAAQAELERKQNVRQVCQKMKARLERGYAVFCPPTGLFYKKTKEHGKLLFPEEPMASVIKEGLEGFANNKFLNQVDLQRFFQSNKDVLGKNEVHLEFVKRTLTEILYAGYIEYTPWNVSRRKGHHEGIIDIETFNKIQKKIERSEPLIKATDKEEFPLRRLVSCSICKRIMTASNVKGKLKYYAFYTCNNRECDTNPKNIQKHILENRYIELLIKVSPEQEIINLAEAIALDVWRKTIEEQKTGANRNKREIASYKVQIQKYIDFAGKTKSDIVREEYETKIEQLRTQMEEAENEAPKLNELEFQEAFNEVEDFLRTPSKYWKENDLEGKLMIHKLIFTENPEFDMKNGFGTPKVSLPFQIKTLLKNGHKPLVDAGPKTWNTFLDTIIEW